MSSSEDIAEAGRLHLAAVQANGAGRPASAARLLRRATAIVDRISEPALAAKILATLAHSESELGRVDAGLDLMADARSVAAALQDPEMDGILHGQSALLLMRRGLLAEADMHFAESVRLIPRQSPLHAVALLNRSALHLLRGDVTAARADVVAGLSSVPPRDDLLQAKLRHNEGYIAFLEADIPEALRAYEAAAALAGGSSIGYRAVIGLDRARALTEVGLLAEAEAELDVVIATLAAESLDQDLAEAELLMAELALWAGRAADSTSLARRARRRMQRRGNETWTLRADLLLFHAALATRRVPARTVEQAVAVRNGLLARGMHDDARTAALLRVRMQLRRGQLSALPALRAGDRIATRLLTRLVRSEIHEHRRDHRSGAAELASGLHELHQHRARFGSLDLTSAAAVHGGDMIARGLRAAVRDGRPSVVHGWIERTRAASLRLTPVRPPADPQAADELAELRAVRAALRAAELGSPADPDLTVRREQLERAVRQRSWLTAGLGATPDRGARLGETRSALGDGCLVSYLVVDSMVHALVVTRSAARVVRLAALADVRADLWRVRSDLDVAALDQVPQPLRRAVRASLAAGLQRLDGQLWDPLSRWTGGGPVVVVPTGSLAAVPWTMLAGLRDRPVTVAPSATWWLRHRHPEPPGGRVVVAAGPGLRRAEEEVAVVARDWPGAVMLNGSDATAGAVLDAAAGAGVLHLAAHGRHEPDNPLFSSVELADGPLFGYDLPRARSLPTHVVLSACDLGLVVERPGDESLGMTSALLHGGVTSVVAGVARVNDDTACLLMIAYHAALRTGLMPSAALAVALRETGSDQADHPAPFVVVGAGW